MTSSQTSSPLQTDHRPTGGAARAARLMTDKASAERLADQLTELLDPDRCAVSIFEMPDGWATEVIFHDDDTRQQVEGIVAAECGPDAQLDIATIEQRDWVAASLEGLAPVRAGRVVIHGAHDRGRVRPNEIGIEIEAALAFGTGHHGTTRGCLLAFDALRKQGRHAQAWRILDIGTGTGVLAIAAARLLNRPVLASDIDPMAVAVARENAKLNHVPSLVSIFTAAGAHAHRFRQAGPYDVIFANILEGPLRRMSASVAPLLAPSGRLILSGLLVPHAKGVIAAYRRQGLVLASSMTLEGWVTLTMRR